MGWLVSSPSQGQPQAAQLQICYVCYILCPGALLQNQNIAGSANIYANEPKALLLSKISDGAHISSCSVSWQGLEGALPASCYFSLGKPGTVRSSVPYPCRFPLPSKTTNSHKPHGPQETEICGLWNLPGQGSVRRSTGV